MKKAFLTIGILLSGSLLVITACTTIPDYSTNLSMVTPDSPEEIPTQTSIAELPTEEPPDPNTISQELPIGYAVQRSCEKSDPCMVNTGSHSFGTELELVSLRGEETVKLYFPSDGEAVHIASEVSFSDPSHIKIIFRNYQNQDFEMIVNGEITKSFSGDHVYRLVGAVNQEVFALSYLPGIIGKGGTDSGNSEILISPGVGPMVISNKPDLLVLTVAIHGNEEPPPNNEALDFWYTFEPYGIGGEIIFPPYRGLYYHPPGNDVEVHELLPDTLQFSSLSPNASLAAFTQLPLGDMTVRDLRVYSEKIFPLLSTSDRGAGFAVFSPDNQMVAWMEAGGSLSDNTLITAVRIGSASGEIVATTLSTVFGESIKMIKPVAWLDNHRVLIQTIPEGKNVRGALAIMRINGEIEFNVSQGTFVSLIYN